MSGSLVAWVNSVCGGCSVGGGGTHVEKRHGVIQIWIVLALAGLDVVFAVGLALRALPGRSSGG